MKRTNKVLLILLVSGISYLLYVHTQNVNRQLELIYAVPDKYTQTSPEADLVVLDFNKYGCIFCQNLHPILTEALKRDGKVRYIPRTVSGDGDEWGKNLIISTYAAGEQGKFIEMHNAIYDNWPVRDREKLFAVAQSIGVDTEQLSRDMSRADLRKWADENNMFFTTWGIGETPTLIIGKRFFRSKQDKPSVEELLAQFAKAR
tara:strand:+ start:10833 stop:11441 length:609 start_codon:yes stop_codon:yes gene_type:complete